MDRSEWLSLRKELGLDSTSTSPIITTPHLPQLPQQEPHLPLLHSATWTAAFQSYWRNFHPSFPIMHRPSTESKIRNGTISPLLAGCMVALGAWTGGDDVYREGIGGGNARKNGRKKGKEVAIEVLEAVGRVLGGVCGFSCIRFCFSLSCSLRLGTVHGLGMDWIGLGHGSVGYPSFFFFFFHYLFFIMTFYGWEQHSTVLYGIALHGQQGKSERAFFRSISQFYHPIYRIITTYHPESCQDLIFNHANISL